MDDAERQRFKSPISLTTVSLPFTLIQKSNMVVLVYPYVVLSDLS